MFESPSTVPTTTPPRTPPPSSVAPKVPTSISSTGIVFEASPKHAREHAPVAPAGDGEEEPLQKSLPATPFHTMQTPQQLPMYASTGRRSGGFDPLGLMGSPTPPVLHFAKSPKLPITPRASSLPVLETVTERGLLDSFNSGEDSVFGEVGRGSISLDQYELNPAYFSPMQHPSHPVLIHLTSSLVLLPSSPLPAATAAATLEEEEEFCINDDEDDEDEDDGPSMVFMAGELSVLEDEEVVVEEPVALLTPFAVRSLQFTDDDDNEGEENGHKSKEQAKQSLPLVAVAGLAGVLVALGGSLCISLQDVKELLFWLAMLLGLFLVWYMGKKRVKV